MKKTGFLVATIFAALLGLQSSFAGDKKAEADAVLEELKQGGFVVFMRHPHTDDKTKDTDKKNLDNCATQRILSEKGREVARKIGEAVKTLQVSFAAVKTSQFCRAREVPELMGLSKPEITANLNHSGGNPADEAKQKAAFLEEVLGTKPAEKTNVLLVSHSPNMMDIKVEALSAKLAPADMLVFKPGEGKPGYKLVAHVTPEIWEEWRAKQKK